MKQNWTCETNDSTQGLPARAQSKMNSSVPYLIRAINDWIVDDGLTPYLVVDATIEGVSVPMKHVKDGQIVLNISVDAVRDLSITNDYVMFSGRFSGVAYEICAPIAAVMGVISKENGEGMWFPRDEDETPSPPEATPPDAAQKDSSQKGKGRPSLKVVK